MLNYELLLCFSLCLCGYYLLAVSRKDSIGASAKNAENRFGAINLVWDTDSRFSHSDN